MYQTRNQKNYLWIFFSMLSVGLGQSLVFTSIPILARESGLNEVQVSMILAFQHLPGFLLHLYGGVIAISLVPE